MTPEELWFLMKDAINAVFREAENRGRELGDIAFEWNGYPCKFKYSRKQDVFFISTLTVEVGSGEIIAHYNGMSHDQPVPAHWVVAPNESQAMLLRLRK